MLNWNLLDKVVAGSKKIFLTTHVNPDADGLGSELAMYYYLKGIGIDCRIINASKTPSYLNFLDPDGVIEVWDKKEHSEWIKNADTSIAFDIGDYKRMNDLSSVIKENNIFSVIIDHHPYDADFFDLVLVDIKIASTGYMVWSYLEHLNFNNYNNISLDALYSALITDTGSFRFNTTDPDCHKMAGFLLEKGVKPYNVYEKIYERRSLFQIKLLSESIKELKFNFNNLVCGVIISKAVQDKAGANYEHVEGFTDFFRSIDGVQIAYCIVEQDYSFRINFRSRGKYIINDIAKSFGGGGHKLAAGASVENLSANEIEDKILNKLKRKIDVDKI
jgi:phosphoesterase RecJ-like protein